MRWFRFYSEALEDPKVQRLSGEVFKTWVNLLCLASRHEQDGRLPVPDDIAFALRLDLDTYSAHITELLERGLIDSYETHLAPHNWEDRQKKSDNVTARVQKHRAQVAQDVTLHETGAERSTEQVHGVLEKTRVETDTEESPLTPQGEREPTPLMRRELSQVQQEQFDRFWRAYPRRQAKADAVRWWQRAKPDPEIVAAMLGAIARQLQGAEWQKEGGRFIPMPSTWLNQRRWEDETIAIEALPHNHPSVAAKRKVYD